MTDTSTAPVVRMLIHLLVTLTLAAVAWVLLGYLATLPLGAIYGWSGHPAMPAAPGGVYVLVYLVLLPVLCLAGAWSLARRLRAAFSGDRR